MANKISVIENKKAEDFVARGSRYEESIPLYYTINDMKYITFSTYRREEIPNTPNDKFSTIPPGMEYRPDLVSQKTYGAPDFWWKIMEANNIKDIFDFKAGLTIRLPDNIF